MKRCQNAQTSMYLKKSATFVSQKREGGGVQGLFVTFFLSPQFCNIEASLFMKHVSKTDTFL